jgi:hypothetical protein
MNANPPAYESVPVAEVGNTWLDKIAAWFDGIGISPKVGSIFVAGLAGIVASWIITGDFGTDELRLLIANFLLGALGVAVPPAANVRQKDISRKDVASVGAVEEKKAASRTRVP